MEKKLGVSELEAAEALLLLGSKYVENNKMKSDSNDADSGNSNSSPIEAIVSPKIEKKKRKKKTKKLFRNRTF